MSTAKTSARRIPDESSAGVDPLSQWVYVSNEGPDITTLENDNHCQSNLRQWKGHAACATASGDTASEEEIATERERGDASQSIREVHRGEFHLGQLRLALSALQIESVALVEIERKLHERLSVSHGVQDSTETWNSTAGASYNSEPLAAGELEKQSELSETSSCDPPMLEEYFDKAREIFVIRERIAELEQQTEEAAVQHADGNGLVGTETKSEVNRARQTLVGALVIAESELHELRESCIRQGIEPEHKRYRRISEPTKRPNLYFPDYCDALTTQIRLVRHAFTATESQSHDTKCHEPNV